MFIKLQQKRAVAEFGQDITEKILFRKLLLKLNGEISNS